MALVKSQCSLPGDTSLLETTELLTKLPPADLLDVMSCKVTLCPAPKYQPSLANSESDFNISHLHLPFFKILQEFNLRLLCPCLSMGVQRLVRGQGSLLMETALQVTLEQMALVTGSLPVPHRSFLPTSQPYSDQVAEVFGECFEKRCVTVYDSTSFVSIEYEIN